MLARTRFVSVTRPATMTLFRNSWGMLGSRVRNPVCQPCSVNGWGMTVSRSASGSVLNDVISCQTNGISISSE
jgi:hypothetical protein